MTEPPPQELDTAYKWSFKHPPRQEQVMALNWVSGVVKAAGDNKIQIIAELPCGIGKSFICQQIANAYSGCIITPTIQLQEQYLEDMDIALIKGAQNYQCDLASLKTSGKLTNCKNGRSVCSKYGGQDMCGYKHAFNAFMRSKIGITNYAYLLNLIKGTEIPHKWLMFDEGHNIIDAMASATALTVFESTTGLFNEPLIRPKYEAAAFKHLGEMIPKADKAANAMAHELEELDPESQEASRMKHDLDRLITFVERANFVIESYENGDDWAYSEEFEEDDRGNKTSAFIGWSMKPLDISYPFKKLKDRFNLFITSGTILNNKLMDRWLGTSSSFINMGSPFPIQQRPIYYKRVGKMSLNERDATMPRMARSCQVIADGMAEYRGIIHTHSFAITAKLCSALRSLGMQDRLIQHVPGENVNALMMRFKMIRNGILVSPSMSEGVDLRQELGRFAIIVKVPYPNLGDEWVKRKKNKDNWWYDWVVSKTIVQQSGRIVRSREDWGHTYILDENFEDFYKRARDFFPDWWRQSLKT